MSFLITFYIALLGTIFFFLVTTFFFWALFSIHLRNRNYVTRSLNLVAIRVKLPSKSRDWLSSFEKLEDVVKVIWNFKEKLNFWHLLFFRTPFVTAELIFSKGKSFFLLYVPRSIESQTKEVIREIYPGAKVALARTLPFVGSRSRINVWELVPSRRYVSFSHSAAIKRMERLAGRLASLANSGVSFGIQFAFKPAPHSVQGSLRKKASFLKKEGILTLSQVLRDKAQKKQFFVNIRLASSGSGGEGRRISALKSVYKFFQKTSLPENSFARYENNSKSIFNFALKVFSGRAFRLSTEELAFLMLSLNYSLSSAGKRSGNLGLGERPAPLKNRRRDVELGRFFNRRDRSSSIGFVNLEDRFSHLYVVGQTGTGKSSLFSEMARQDIEKGRGVCVIDPHGDLVERIASNVSPQRMKDVIYFDASDRDFPPPLNILDFSEESEKDLIVQEVLEIFRKLFPKETIGPIFEHNIRNVVLTLMSDRVHPGTLVDIPRILTDETFRRLYLKKIRDPFLNNFWNKERTKLTFFHESEMLEYLVSKLSQFSQDRLIRNIIGQEHSIINFKKIIQGHKVLLVNLNKGRVGELNAQLLGLIMTSLLQVAIMSQSANEQERIPFFLYIDEFQNFTTSTITSLLAEGRKYKLSVNIAHQFINQLPSQVFKSILGNTGSLIAFRLGMDDAMILDKEFRPNFSSYEMMNLDNFRALAKLFIGGRRHPPVLIQTNIPREGAKSKIEQLRDNFRRGFCVPRKEVERRLLAKFK